MKTTCTISEHDTHHACLVATAHLFKEIKRVLGEQECCVVGLTGGTSVKELLEDVEHELFFNTIIEQQSFFDTHEWQRVHFVYAQERIGPQEQSVHAMTTHALLDALSLYTEFPEHHVHQLYITQDAQKSADMYNRTVQSLPSKGIDILLLSVHKDGTIAGVEHGKTGPGFVAHTNAGKAYVSINNVYLRQAHATFLFFLGADKHTLLHEYLSNDNDVSQCPAKKAREGEPQERLYIVTDAQ